MSSSRQDNAARARSLMFNLIEAGLSKNKIQASLIEAGLGYTRQKLLKDIDKVKEEVKQKGFLEKPLGKTEKGIFDKTFSKKVLNIKEHVKSDRSPDRRQATRPQDRTPPERRQALTGESKAAASKKRQAPDVQQVKQPDKNIKPTQLYKISYSKPKKEQVKPQNAKKDQEKPTQKKTDKIKSVKPEKPISEKPAGKKSDVKRQQSPEKKQSDKKTVTKSPGGKVSDKPTRTPAKPGRTDQKRPETLETKKPIKTKKEPERPAVRSKPTHEARPPRTTITQRARRAHTARTGPEFQPPTPRETRRPEAKTPMPAGPQTKPARTSKHKTSQGRPGQAKEARVKQQDLKGPQEKKLLSPAEIFDKGVQRFIKQVKGPKAETPKSQKAKQKEAQAREAEKGPRKISEISGPKPKNEGYGFSLLDKKTGRADENGIKRYEILKAFIDKHGQDGKPADYIKELKKYGLTYNKQKMYEDVRRAKSTEFATTPEKREKANIFFDKVYEKVRQREKDAGRPYDRKTINKLISDWKKDSDKLSEQAKADIKAFYLSMYGGD